MIELIEIAFSKFHKRYIKILNGYYPAHKSTGFTERNLTHNFISSLESVLDPDYISWFEAPINTQERRHLDAVIFDTNRKISFLIEAKRLSHVDKKIGSVKNDIRRMLSSVHIELLEKGLYNISIEKRYAIVLADVWTESNAKQSVFDTWPDCIREPNIVWHNRASFECLKTQEQWKNNYKLLIAVLEIK